MDDNPVQFKELLYYVVIGPCEGRLHYRYIGQTRHDERNSISKPRRRL